MGLKHYIILLPAMAALHIQQGKAQQGFVQQEIIKVQGITTDAMVYPLSDIQKQTTRSYYDGLGRAVQTIGVQASPLQNDLIQPAAYDNLGRQTTGYLPYAGQSTDITGSYRTNALTTAQPAFYGNTGQYLVATDAAPYAQKVFENSPLQRLLQEGMTGSGYQPGVSGSHTKTISYRPNSSAADGSILQWNPDGSYTANTYYAAGTLWVTDGTDEDLVETRVFTDLAGRTILKRQLLNGAYLDTYYIYDNAGLLIYIVPPKAVGMLNPAVSFTLTGGPASTLVFYFAYNTHGQLTQKTVPAKGTMSIVYDPLNRPVLAQDANMAANKQWYYIKYDAKGRAVSQGIYTDANYIGWANMQSYVSGLTNAYNSVWYESRSNAAGGPGYYTDNVFPQGTVSGTSISPLAYAYFDDYNMTEVTAPTPLAFNYHPSGLAGDNGPTTAQVKGMPTIVTKTTVGAGIAAGTWLTSVVFYDHRLHPIQVQTNNQLSYTGATTVTDYKTTVTDFTGMPVVSQVSKTVAGNTTTVQTTPTYDHMYRPTSVTQQYGSNAGVQVAAYNYNELGQLIKKNLGSTASDGIQTNLNLSAYSATTAIAVNSVTLSAGFTVPAGSTFNAYTTGGYLQSVNYRYNIRGQLLSINNSTLSNDNGVTSSDANDLFGMQFLYDQQDPNLVNTPRYDGKLTAVKWMAKDGVGYQRAFKYSYDQLNRYTGSTYAESAPSAPNTFTSNKDGFDENNISYDAGGNLLSLNRNSSTEGTNSNVQIDNLTYTYNAANPNQLYQVTDGTGSNYTGAGFRNLTGAGSSSYYQYDNNGNLTNDPYKGLSIGYDVLNRTDKITVTAGTNQYITYTYDASGTLIRKQAYNNNILGTQTDYIDGFVYLTVSGTTTLSYFPMPEGRVLNNGGGTYKQEFVITDQQGNARLSFQDNGSGIAVVKQENSYYGFGLVMPNSPVGLPTPPNRQLYNGGSEWQNDYSNLPDYYQTYFRNYDAALGRFVGVDPIAESAESMTGYQYAGNNPIMLNDPMGDLIKYAPQSPTATPAPTNIFPFSSAGGSLIDPSDGGGSGDDGDYVGPDGDGGSAIDGGDYSNFWNGLFNSGVNFQAYYNAYKSGTLGISGFNDNPADYQTPANSPDQANANAAAGVSPGAINSLSGSGGSDPTVYYASASHDLSYIGNANQGGFDVKSGVTANGAYININYTASPGSMLMYRSYQWIQTVSSSGEYDKAYGLHLHSPHVDGSRDSQGRLINYPFYWTAFESQFESVAPFTQYSAGFRDYPGGESWFQAEVTLVGIGFNGSLTPLGSYNWGYAVGNNGVPVAITPMFSPTPSSFQQGIIQNYNNR